MTDILNTHSETPAAAGRHSFVIRIWHAAGRPGWEGWVQHARSGETASVRSVDELVAFIERRAGNLAPTRRDGLR
jgi:hypothetical protein